MRHRHGYRKLGRTSSHRAALLKNLSISLIEHGKIETTVEKAKQLRSYVEKLITIAGKNDSNAHKAVFAALQSKEATKTLVNEIAPKYVDRPGGYTRILKTGNRLGDNAAMCFIELVDYNENMLKDNVAKKAAKTRRSRKKATTDAPAAEVAESSAE